jgi:hypothetical protein
VLIVLFYFLLRHRANMYFLTCVNIRCIASYGLYSSHSFTGVFHLANRKTSVLVNTTRPIIPDNEWNRYVISLLANLNARTNTVVITADSIYVHSSYPSPVQVLNRIQNGQGLDDKEINDRYIQGEHWLLPPCIEVMWKRVSTRFTFELSGLDLREFFLNYFSGNKLAIWE